MENAQRDKARSLVEMGQRIRQLRENLNMSQQELATRAGYKSRSSINKIELGKNDLSQSKIKEIASALNTTHQYLMDGTDSLTFQTPNEVGARIREAREAKDMSQEELGKACGTTKQTIYKYESGVVTNVPLDRIEKIADVLGVSAAYLVGWNEDIDFPSNIPQMPTIMKLSEIIKRYRLEYGISQRQMGAQCKLSTGYISLIEKEFNPQTGKKMVPSLTVMNKLATGMGITLDELLAMCDDMDVNLSDKDTITPSNILPMPAMRKIPLVGTIACGTPILAEQNIECDVDIPEHIHADFALRCKGDSMINARIYDGDIVYIRSQPKVENGEIAAVEIEGEGTLKRVYIFPDQVVLQAENPRYEPSIYKGAQLAGLRILGKAVGFTAQIQ